MQYPKWKVALILGLSAFFMAFAAPNLFSAKIAEKIPTWLPHKQLSLGLDLQGGSHLLLEVDVNSVMREWMNTLVDAVRQELRKEKIAYKGLGTEGGAIAVTITEPDKVDQARQIVRKIDSSADLTVEAGGTIKLKMSDRERADRIKSAIDQSMQIVWRRIDETGVREPTIQRQGEDRILVQLPGLDDPERVKRLLGKTAKMTFHLVDEKATPADAAAGRLPPGSMLLPGTEDPASRGGGPREYVVERRVMVSGESLIDAQPTYDQGRPVVNFRFDPMGAKKFGDVTAKNVGRLFAIVLDGKVISAPVIREPILGGSGVISGSFTTDSARDLALLLRAGALPAPLTILEERTVGPGLGADSIQAGKLASAVGSVLVVVFMLVTYGLFGIFANLALVVNIVMIIGIISALQGTLTLPGIAGIVLTIGMAVDANVLINERIREEVRNGRSVISALDAGFSRATATIIDANATHLIAALLLYEFGSGPVRGFALTLGVGIATSLFTSTTLVRWMVSVWLRTRRPKVIPF